MDNLVFTVIVVTGFAIAFLHAAIPTHWLPFVVAARAQQWNKTKTLAITGVAGAGHVLFTTTLGVLVVWGGIAINDRLGRTFPLIAGGALIALGLFYFFRQRRGNRGHVHLFAGHSHPPLDETSEFADAHGDDHLREQHNSADLESRIAPQHRRKSDWAAILGLFALLAFSPCEAFLPVFLTGARYGWFGFALLSAILAVGTVAGMLAFTWLTLLGLQRLRLKTLEHYEPLLVSGVFCLLGLVVIVFEH